MAITLNNVGNVKFLRNGALYAGHDAALTALSGFQITDEQDGTAVLARYSGETASDVKTLVGWIYVNGATKTITIQDTEGASQDLLDYLGTGVTKNNNATMQLNALSGTNADTSATTSVAGAKAYAKDYTDEQIGNLDYSGITTGDGAVVTNVTEADGKIAATSENVGNLKLTGYSKGSDSGSVATTDSINQAISKLENQVDAANDAIDEAIEGLDYTDTAATKQFIAKVDENNGVISVERGELQSSGKTIVITADGNDVNFEANVDGETIVIDENTGVMSVASSALVQYEGDDDTVQISAVQDGVRIVSSPLTISATTPTEANVKEQYNLVGASGTTIGATIKIYKDSALLSVALLHADTTSTPQVLPTYDKATNTWTDIASPTQENQALCYAYEDVSGNTVVAAVPVGAFINEQEFASGITWDATAGKVKGVVDGTSESFLTVGADGFKLSGVQDAIDDAVDTAISGLDATVSAETAHITVQIDEVDGKLTAVTLTEDDIASADDIEELSAKTVTEIDSSNASISATTAATADGTVGYDLVTDASKIKMTGFTAAESGFTAITEASTITEAVKAIETEVIANEETVAAALTDLDTRMNNLESDVQTISGNVNTISGKVDTIEEKYISGVSVNGHDVTVADKVAPISITAATSAVTATSTEAIVVNTDSSGNITLGLATIDCGTY